MSELPVNWVRTPLVALGQWGSGGTPKRTNPEYYDGGKIPWLIIGDLNDDVVKHSATHITEVGLANSSAKLLPAETLLIAMYGSIGKLGITGIECATNQAIAFCKPDNDVTTLRYLFYALMNAKSGLIAQGQGGAQQNISQGILKAHEVPLAPLNEQKRIADKLDAVLARVDACRDRLDRIPAILKRFRQSVLATATSGKLTEEWRISRSEASGQYVSSEIYNELPDLPSSWRYEKLGKLLLDLKYGTSQKCEYEKKGKPVFRIPNIGDGVLIDDNMKYAELPEKEHQQLALQAGDILMIRSNGSVSLVGKTALVSSDFVGYAYAGYLIRLRPTEEVQSDYLNHVLASMWLRQQIEIPARSTSGINNINSEEVRNLLIPRPPVDEQIEIVRRVESLFAYADRLEARYIVARSQVGKLTPSTLAKAFRGELVPQDPKDEPASVLLERVRAKQNVQMASKPKRGSKAVA